MKRALIVALAGLGAVTMLGAPGTPLLETASAKDKDKGFWERWDDRRDARRAGAIARLATSELTKAAAESAAEKKRDECMERYDGDTAFELYCREQYIEDRQKARRTARRAGIIAGITTREIVRD